MEKIFLYTFHARSISHKKRITRNIKLRKILTKPVCIIPARGGSKGVPKKNIRLIAGKPLIYYTIKSALRSKIFSHVIVSTEDKKIASIAKKYGAVCTPDPFLFDSERKLVFHGRIDNAMKPEDTATEKTMIDNIQKFLGGEKIEKDFDPSIGCSIKWK